MSAPELTTLESFHRFVAEQLRSNPAAQMSPEQALALWRDQQQAVQAIREGLADVAAGRTKPLDDFLRDFETRHRVAGE